MKDLDEAGHRLLAYLVAHLPAVKPKDLRTFDPIKGDGGN